MHTTLPDLDAGTGGAPAPRSRAPSQRGKRRARSGFLPLRKPAPAKPIHSPSTARGRPSAGTGRHREELAGIATEFGITIVPTSRRRQPGETHAGGALAEILRDHGADHLRQVLRLVRETGPNHEALWSEIFVALSDVLVSIPAWKDREPELSTALDGLCLQKAREKAVSLRPWPVRGSLRALLWIALEKQLGPAD